jgi:hypothetical protein
MRKIARKAVHSGKDGNTDSRERNRLLLNEIIRAMRKIARKAVHSGKDGNTDSRERNRLLPPEVIFVVMQQRRKIRYVLRHYLESKSDEKY